MISLERNIIPCHVIKEVTKIPRNSQGLYTLPAGNPVVPNTLIEANWANPTMDDIAAALTGSLPRDGSAPMTGPLTLASGMPTAARHATSKAYVDQFLAYASGLPVGAVTAYAGSAVPAGYFECNGQAISRTTYSALFAAIGTTYGAGDSSTTFNVPDMRDEFIRGKSDMRPLGNKQAGSFASHIHTTSDPGHGHTLTDPGHVHSASQPAHTHGVTDPGHVHGAGFQIAGLGVNAATAGTPWQANTNSAQTGISIQAGGGDAVTVGGAATGVSLANNTTGLSIGAAGGDETRPQNIAQIYIIKAVQDASGPVAVTSIDTSDAAMISVDNTSPVAPELVIHSNVAFGTVKLDASGKVPQSLVNISTFQYIGPWDASGGQNPSQALPSEVFANGDLYQISVGGTIQLHDASGTLLSTPVVSTDQITFVTGSTVGLPDGWYFQPTTAIIGVTAGAVSFIPTGSIGSTNVQNAIVEVANEAAPIGHVGTGGSQHADVVAAGTSGFMTGADKTKLNGIEANAQVNTVGSVNSKTGTVVLTAADVGALTQSGADSLYVNVSGDTMSGNLQTPALRLTATDEITYESSRVSIRKNGGANLAPLRCDAGVSANDAVVMSQFPSSVPGGTSPSNYTNLPNGVQVRFGSGNGAGAPSVTIDFVDFVGGCVAFVVSGDVNNPVVENVGSRTRFSTQIVSAGGGNVWGYSWIAIGA